MSNELNAPVFPESVEEGTLMTWLKEVGDAVALDEKVAEIETDKVVLEVAAQAEGVLESISKQEGDTVQSGEQIGRIGEGDGTTKPAAESKAKPKAESEPEPAAEAEAESEPEPEAESEPEAEQAEAEASAPPEPASAPEAPEPEPVAAKAAVSPAARKLMNEHGISPDEIEGSGRRGRVTKEDVLSFLASRTAGTTPEAVVKPAPEPDEEAAPSPTPAPQPRPEPQPAPKPAPQPAPRADGAREDERVPMSRIRARIAQRLVDAQQNMAILTTFNEVNMQPVMDLRTRHKDTFEKAHGVKLGFMSFFVKAVVEALRKYPTVNASIEDNEIVYHHYYDIGIAVSSPRGLLVPILRDADRREFSDIELGIRDFGARAQSNQIGIEELQGGTFTISNGGVFGSLLSTPILNPPQSGILGMHAINDRPMAENGEVVIRPMMYLALSYDHRIIDGREAVLFLVTVKEMLEDPARLLLKV